MVVVGAKDGGSRVFCLKGGGVFLTSGFPCCWFVVYLSPLFFSVVNPTKSCLFFFDGRGGTLVSDPQGLVWVCQHPVELQQDLPQKSEQSLFNSILPSLKPDFEKPQKTGASQKKNGCSPNQQMVLVFFL